MQITKKLGIYHTQDGQQFRTLGEASGHARRLAVAHYLQVVRHELHEEVGLIPRKQRDLLRDLSASIAEIMEETPDLIHEDTTPKQLAA